MDWGKVRFFWSEVAQNFTRNAAMAVTAIGTVAISIIVLGVFLFLRSSSDIVMKSVVSKLEIAVYLKDEVEGPTITAMLHALQIDPRVDSARFVSKNQALADLRKRLHGQVDLGLINSNPLPNSIIIHTIDPENVPVVAQEFTSRPEVSYVNYGSQHTQKLLRAETVFGYIGIGIIVLLLIANALIIYNTIRLTVFARQREINIMHLVGATRWTIRWPFVLEGVLSGLIGAAVGLAVLWPTYHALVPKLALNLPFLPLDLSAVPVGHIALELLLIGGLIGMFSSWISVSRFVETA
ncbi:MAG TPA: permease-like cell division protein FtsX [Candidatus Tumulicola sp.]|nr:permease-like cell division protein FtsX [Candidatus Tumulicola sp.]